MHTEYMKLFIVVAAFCFANSDNDDFWDDCTDSECQINDSDCKGFKYACVGPTWSCGGNGKDDDDDDIGNPWICIAPTLDDYDAVDCNIGAKVNWCGCAHSCNARCIKLNNDLGLNQPCQEDFGEVELPHHFDNTVLGHLCVWDNCGTSDDTVKVPCAAGSHCQRKSEWWWQCQENDDRVLYSEAKKESCFTTNNGFYHQDTHGPWGCESDGDCCNRAAKCVNGLCELSCGTE